MARFVGMVYFHEVLQILDLLSEIALSVRLGFKGLGCEDLGLGLLIQEEPLVDGLVVAKDLHTDF